MINPQQQNITPLCVLRPATALEVRTIIMNSPSKSCELDPMPTWLLKKCIGGILPIIVRLVNTSLRSGRFPDSFKEAVIRPILKKPNLNTDELKNYRPVSNLQFVSKIIEKTVMARLEEHIVDNNLHDPSQSAYKKCHSTETALLKIHNDILASLDNKHCIILASLDLSAAFDTVDHTILLHRLQNDFGIEGKALQWFTSFITGRTQRVCIDGNSSDLHQLICGVPQGSVLGARMYTMYTQMLANVIRKHDVQHHSYADDTQVYVRCEDNEDARSAAIVKLQSCISDICEWMRANALKLNETKTECIVFSRNKDPTSITVTVGTQSLDSQHTVKILGVTFDNNMTFENHVSNICRSIHMNIRKIRRIRKYLTYEAVKTLVQCTVTVRLDYCNSLYCGLPLKTIKKLQLAQNAAARLIAKISPRESISHILIDLHWLPVTKRCQYKLMVLTYKLYMALHQFTYVTCLIGTTHIGH